MKLFCMCILFIEIYHKKGILIFNYEELKIVCNINEGMYEDWGGGGLQR